MNEFQAAAVLIGFFALRCVLPLVLMMLIGFGMNKLVDRWAAEEEARLEGVPAAAARPRLPATTIPCWLFKNCDEKTRLACPATERPGIPCWLLRMQAAGRLPERCKECAIYRHNTYGEPLPQPL
jgi:hypothetical protein